MDESSTMNSSELDPRYVVNRALRSTDQLSGLLGAAGLIVTGVALFKLDNKSPSWPFYLTAALLLLPAVLLLVSRYGMHYSEVWGPRLARRVSIGILTAPVVLTAIAVIRIGFMESYTMTLPLMLLIPPSLLAYSLVRDLPVMIRLCSPVVPRGTVGFEPIFPAANGETKATEAPAPIPSSSSSR